MALLNLFHEVMKLEDSNEKTTLTYVLTLQNIREYDKLKEKRDMQEDFKFANLEFQKITVLPSYRE
jgi:hypothetical protein